MTGNEIGSKNEIKLKLAEEKKRYKTKQLKMTCRANKKNESRQGGGGGVHSAT